MAWAVGARPQCARGAQVTGAAANTRSVVCAARRRAAHRISMTVAASARAMPVRSVRAAAARVADIRTSASPAQACLAGVDADVGCGTGWAWRAIADGAGGVSMATRA